MIYFDTSYIVRLYYEDRGFEAVRRLAATNTIASSQHGRVEVVAAFHRKFREGNISAEVFRIVLKQFQDDCKSGAYRWLPCPDVVLDCIEKVYAQLPAAIFLRAADALHLATAAENEIAQIYSNDAKLLQAASFFGVEGVNVI